MCGDSADVDDFDKLLNGDSIHLVNCDPPYNIKVEPASAGADTGGQRPAWRSSEGQVASGHKKAPKKKEAKKQEAKGRRLANDFMTEEDFDSIVRSWFSNLHRSLIPGRSFYIWGAGWPADAGAKANSEVFPFELRQVGLKFAHLIIWDKGAGVINRKDFMGQYEVCFYGWKGGAGHSFYGPSNATDIWTTKKVAHASMIHLTEKPVELAIIAIQYSSQPCENVLDIFGGSGSTLMGCEQTNRRNFSMELDPLYCDVIVNRWEEFTGRKAELCPATSGED